MDNREVVKKAFSMENSYFYPVCAAIITENGEAADVERLKECRAILKSKTGMFSNFRGAAVSSIITMLSLDCDPEGRLDRALAFHKELREHFYSSEYLPVAAMMLSDAVDPEKYSEVSLRARKIYDLMKSEHPFLTSSEDSVFAVMLALSSLSDDEVIRQTEICYNALRERFKSRNAVQSLSHVLALYSDSSYTAADRCRNTIALYDALREKGMKYGTEYELATLGTLAMLDCSIDETVADLEAVDAFLSEQKGYGFFGASRKERLMHAAMIVVGEHSGETHDMNATAIGGTIAMIAAQHAATCAAIMSASAAASAASAAR
ncbi:MAG: DUF4003 domain-containing protein [Clostridia bacterium]|nr:DUF4003 domain-containing protein [Clostridia bacterium]